MKKIKITKRDLALLSWINTVGFVNIEHVVLKFSISKRIAYRRLRILIDDGYLLHQKIFHNEAGVFCLTQKGVNLSNSLLPPLRKISLATYHHDVLVTKILLQLEKTCTGQIIPERVIRHGKGHDAFARRGHTPDGVLAHNDNKKAIEVELSKKSKRRLDKIFNYHLKTFDYQEVWYFCGNSEIEKLIEPYSKKMPFLKIFDVDDYLQNHQYQLAQG